MTEKSLPQPSSPQGAHQARSRRFTTYSLIWATAATASLLYLVVLAAQPALVAQYLGSGTKTAETEATQHAVGEAVAEVRGLRDTIDLFRSELIEIRAQVSSQNDIARDLATRVAAIEAEPADPLRVSRNATGKDAPAKIAQANKTAQAKEAPAKAAKAKGEPDQTATAAATPAQKAAKDAATKKTAAKSGPNLETGSVASPAARAITFGPPTVTPTALPPTPATGSMIGVQIATGPSVDSLRLSWTLLNERHGESFRALEPRYTTDVSGPEQTYDLVVGPVASIDDARRLCQELAMKATPCTVSRFTGDAL